MTDLVSTFFQIRNINIDVDLDGVFIFLGPPAGESDGGIWLMSKLYFIALDYENTRLDIVFCDDTRQRKCCCQYIACRHTDRYWEMLWMESDDWGLRDLFERCAHDIEPAARSRF